MPRNFEKIITVDSMPYEIQGPVPNLIFTLKMRPFCRRDQEREVHVIGLIVFSLRKFNA